jgi:hypothetical protein
VWFSIVGDILVSLITSSASCWNCHGISSPRDFAVLRLMINPNLLGRSMAIRSEALPGQERQHKNGHECEPAHICSAWGLLIPFHAHYTSYLTGR